MKFLLILLFPSITLAWIPPARMIIERTADNAGSGTYLIDQEVQFPNGNETLNLRENWVVENDHSMKVTVTGPNIKLQILYVGGLRWILRDGRRESSGVPSDFAERLFHWRNIESAAPQLTALKIASPRLLQRKPAPKKAEDVRNESEDGVRLGRTGGVIVYAFGTPTVSTSASTSGDRGPGLWIEQDQFLIRKVRFPSDAEITADNYSSYARGLQFPKNRTIQWGAHTVSLRVLSVAGRSSGGSLTTSALDTSWRTQGLDGQVARDVVEEFYKRFR